jgi:hypothetical protein
VDVAQVVDLKSLEAYLKALPEAELRDTAPRIAFRAAARVLPIAARDFLTSDWAQIGSLTPVAIFGALSISEVSRASSTSDIEAVAFAVDDLAADAYNADAEAHAAATTYAAIAANAAAAASKAASTAINFATAATATAAAAYAADAAAAAAAAAVAAYADAGEIDFWAIIRMDLSENNLDLWPNSIPTAFSTIWAEARQAMQSHAADWSFWELWYERVLSGRDRHPLALAPILGKIGKDEEWMRGPAHINPMFNEVLAVYRAEDVVAQKPQQLPITLGRADDIERTKAAMVAHRRELQPTFESILDYIELEIDRLQRRNYRGADDQEETERLIGVLLTLRDAVGRLMALVPQTQDMPRSDAVEAEGLARLYLRKFREWPRVNVDEMTDNTFRLALIGLTALAAPMVGASPNFVVGLGAVMFGGDRVLKNAKIVKDLNGGRD